jgi:shikimate dehydrogenase
MLTASTAGGTARRGRLAGNSSGQRRTYQRVSCTVGGHASAGRTGRGSPLTARNLAFATPLRRTEPWVGRRRPCPHWPRGASVGLSMPIGANTRTCAIFGHPVRHSLSPALHNAAFEALGLDFVYVAHDVLAEQLVAAIVGARALGYRGLSITIPHKVQVMGLVDEVDRVATGIGCINTIVNEGGRLRGYNSDGAGALQALRRADADPTDRNVVIIGSGGAARAIAVTMALEAPPKRLTILGIVARELDQLASDLRDRSSVDVSVGQMDAERLACALADAHLLMTPHCDVSPVPSSLLRPDLVVFDAIYTPRRTKLLIEAQAAGSRVVEGLEMFLGQARTQFELFTGHAPPDAVMRSVVESRLGQ